MLKHDKILSKKLPAPHLRDLPSYLIDRKTQEASKIVRLTEDALQQKKTNQRQQRSKKKFKRSRDPLKTFSAGVSEFMLIIFPDSAEATLEFVEGRVAYLLVHSVCRFPRKAERSER